MPNESTVLSREVVEVSSNSGRPPGSGARLVATGFAPDDPALLLTAAAAAQLCGVSLRTWRRFEAEGMVPRPVLLGGRIRRYRRTELLAWMEAGCPSVEQWQNIRQVELRRRAR